MLNISIMHSTILLAKKKKKKKKLKRKAKKKKKQFLNFKTLKTLKN